MSTPTLLEAPPANGRSGPTLRTLAPVLLAGGVSGLLVGGLGSRIVMRIAALAAPDRAQGTVTEAGATVGRITSDGTLFLLVFVGIGTAVVGTALYLVTRPWLPRRRRVRAAAFGVLELVVFGSTVIDAGNPDFAVLGRPLLNVVLFASLFVLHGVALVLLIAPCGRIVSRVSKAPWRARVVGAGTLVGLGLTLVGVAAIGARSGGSDRLTWIVLVICAAGLTLIDRRHARPITMPALRVVGASALALIAIAGAAHLLDEVTTIV
jgi:hypothetical protein